jgi:hypothetical protein
MTAVRFSGGAELEIRYLGVCILISHRILTRGQIAE